MPEQTEKKKIKAKVLSGVGGLYRVLTENGETLECRARGSFRHSGISPYPGDNVLVTEEGTGMCAICEILDRKNIFERPPAANIDKLFITVAAASPSPAYITVDKLLCAAEYYGAESVILVTKSDLDREKAREIEDIYLKSGYTVFVTSSLKGEGVEELKRFVYDEIRGCTAAFAGESGVGKSSLMNALFPDLKLQTGEVSRKIARGRHTTRAVTLYPLDSVSAFTGAFLADTPGFGIFELSSIDKLVYDEVPELFPEFSRYFNTCKYRKCTHLREEGCEVLSAVAKGDIAVERHDSYVKIYEEIKALRPWQTKKTQK
ncbi:MAG: ribosome small subunit-dependent GTPase A [Clostridia bacterium]|nr:ribosome small subunit-dependent GTPase A [Clostridia bacterium]